MRFSFVPIGSRTPRRFSCRPANSAEATRVRPQFTSIRYGDPGYGQLGRRVAPEILKGADDEAEMGAFHDSDSRSGKPICACGSMNTCASVSTQAFSTRADRRRLARIAVIGKATS